MLKGDGFCHSVNARSACYILVYKYLRPTHLPLELVFSLFFLKRSLELVYSASSSRPLSQFQFSGRSLVKIPAIEPVHSLAHLFPFLFSFNSHLPVVGLCLPRRAAPAPEKRGAGRAHGIGGVGRGDRAIIFLFLFPCFSSATEKIICIDYMHNLSFSL